jgi:hypothetical protein
VRVVVIDKKRGVEERWNKTDGLDKSGEALKLGMRSLFETIKRFLKKTHMIR